MVTGSLPDIGGLTLGVDADGSIHIGPNGLPRKAVTTVLLGVFEAAVRCAQDQGENTVGALIGVFAHARGMLVEVLRARAVPVESLADVAEACLCIALKCSSDWFTLDRMLGGVVDRARRRRLVGWEGSVLHALGWDVMTHYVRASEAIDDHLYDGLIPRHYGHHGDLSGGWREKVCMLVLVASDPGRLLEPIRDVFVSAVDLYPARLSEGLTPRQDGFTALLRRAVAGLPASSMVCWDLARLARRFEARRTNAVMARVGRSLREGGRPAKRQRVCA